jgi:hypothetical protein
MEVSVLLQTLALSSYLSLFQHRWNGIPHLDAAGWSVGEAALIKVV